MAMSSSALWFAAAFAVAVSITGCGGSDSAGDAAAGAQTRSEALATTGTWTRVATEWQSFNVDGTQTVRYGYGTSWVQKDVTGTVQCTNAYFGNDPAYGTLKSCEVLVGAAPGPAPGVVTWTRIAEEWQSFNVEGTQRVRFGVDTRWVEKLVTGSGACTFAYFGSDPAYRRFKYCEVASVTGQPPVPSIDSPALGATFRAGDTLAFAGSATDPEDGALDATRLTWWVELRHDVHGHPLQPETVGAAGAVEIPTRGETSDNIWYRFYLRATDSSGATAVVTRDVLPLKSNVTLQTSPPGLALTLDGQPLTAPMTFTGVVGIERDLAAPTQDVNGRRYQFERWSDGGSASHTISTPSDNTTYTATYTDIGPVGNVAPTVALTAPSGGSVATIGVPVTLTAGAADSDGNLVGVEFFENGVKIGATDTSSPYSVAWTPATTGSRALSARATDDDGQATTSAVVAVTVVPASGNDTQAPVATLTAPANFASGLNGTINLAASATDNVGVTALEIQVDGVRVGNVGTASPYTVPLDTTAYASGQHIVRARATDAAGNASPWVSSTVSFGGGRTQPRGFSRNESWVTGLSSATALTQAPDGRIFVAQQGGALRVVKNGALLSAPFVSLSVDSSGERGLIGVALHPGFATNGHVYVYRTVTQNGTHNRISRYTADPANPDVAAAGSEVVIADLPALSGATNHNGGAMNFGVDGKLYVAVGDNASGANSQNMGTALGKMLRLNDDGTIPSDNPYASSQSGLARAIWARGLRNPFTFAIQPGTGRMYINDVGQDTWEEVNLGAPGANYGWPGAEGPSNNGAGVTAPLFAYKHSAASPAGSGPGGFFTGYAITGGAFYPASGPFPAAYRDSYYFADYVTHFVGRLDLANGNAAYAFGSVSGDPVGLLTGNDGALYLLTRSSIVRFSAP